MGSFTDRPVQFNPYIQQLPVEAMVEVGMEKQRRYDEGVERIQGTIDKIMDLDIVKDAHKTYLQDRLTQLGHNLRGVAAGDFSNMQLVKNVSGMAGKIGRDPIVQNAVNSTAQYRRQTALIEEARKQGTLGLGNEYIFQLETSKWMKDPDLAKPFNVLYEPYYDVAKKLADAMGTVKPDGYNINQVFQTDSQGLPLLDEKGVPILSTVMVEKARKGIFPEKVRAVIDAVLSDPKAARQMQIDGIYNYRGYDALGLARKVVELKEDQKSTYNKALADLLLKKSTLKDPKEIEAIDSQVSSLKDAIEQIDNQFDRVILEIPRNPDAIRGMIHRNETINSWQKMYTSVEETTTLKENPYWRAEFDIQKEANDLSIKREQLAIDWARLGLDKDKFEYQKTQDVLKLQTEGGMDLTMGATPSDVDLDTQFQQSYTQAVSEYSTMMDNLLYEVVGKGVLPGSFDPTYLMQKWGKKDAMKFLVDATAKRLQMTPEEFRATYGNKTKEYFNVHPEELTPEISLMKSSIENASRIVNYKQQIKNYVDRIAPVSDTKEGKKMRNDAFQSIIYMNPTMKGSIPTGETKLDKKIYANVGAILNEYRKAGKNYAEDFMNNVDEMVAITLKPESGDIAKVASVNESTGKVEHRLIFYNQGGVVGEAVITDEEAASVNFDTKKTFSLPDIKMAYELMRVNGGKTSRRDPASPSSYINNDALLVKANFPKLSKYKGDVKANLKEATVMDEYGRVSTMYIPFLYVSGVGVTALSPQASVEEAVQRLKGIDEVFIDKYILK